MLKQTCAVCNPYVGVYDSKIMPTVQNYGYMVPPGPFHNVGNGKWSKVQSFCSGRVVSLNGGTVSFIRSEDVYRILRYFYLLIFLFSWMLYHYRHMPAIKLDIGVFLILACFDDQLR